MKYRHLLWLFTMALIVGCAAQTASRPDSRTEIVVDRSLSQAALPAWLFYGGSRSLWMDKTFFERNPGAVAYRYSFAEEVEARDACAQVWRDLKAKDGRSDRYLDDLATVQAAGFLREYTRVSFRDPGWSVPEGLRLAEFDQWRQPHLRNHRPETRVVVRFREK